MLLEMIIKDAVSRHDKFNGEVFRARPVAFAIFTVRLIQACTGVIHYLKIGAEELVCSFYK